MNNFKRVVSATTRIKRNNEINGVDYHFLTKEKFENTDLIEKTIYEGNPPKCYGIPRNEIVDDKINVVVINQDGVINIKKQFKKKKIFTILLNVPNEELLERYIKRSTLPKELALKEFNERMNKDDLDFSKDFSYDLILNNTPENYKSNYKEILNKTTKLNNGDIVCIMGKAGSGKTSIENLLIKGEI